MCDGTYIDLDFGVRSDSVCTESEDGEDGDVGEEMKDGRDGRVRLIGRIDGEAVNSDGIRLSKVGVDGIGVTLDSEVGVRVDADSGVALEKLESRDESSGDTKPFADLAALDA